MPHFARGRKIALRMCTVKAWRKRREWFAKAARQLPRHLRVYESLMRQQVEEPTACAS
jgi:hypothetical protein